MKHSVAFQLSLWARNHKVTTWILILLSKLLLAFIGLFSGFALFDSGIRIPWEPFMFLLLMVAVVCFICYPRHKKTDRKATYVRRKTLEGALALNGLLFFLVIGNGLFINSQEAVTPVPVVSVWGAVPLNSSQAEKQDFRPKANKIGKFKSWMIEKTAKKLQKWMSKKAKAGKPMEVGLKILLGILTVLLGAALLYLVAVLACSLSCSGQESLAVLVAVFGVIGVVTGVVFSFIALTRAD